MKTSAAAAKTKKTSKQLTKADVEITDRATNKMLGDLKGKGHNLPLVSAVFDDTVNMQEAIKVLERAHSHKEILQTVEESLNIEKGALTAMAAGAGVPGFRYGNMAVTVNLIPGRSTLSADKLRALGVDEDIIGKAMEQGDSYYRVEIFKIAR